MLDLDKDRRLSRFLEDLEEPLATLNINGKPAKIDELLENKNLIETKDILTSQNILEGGSSLDLADIGEILNDRHTAYIGYVIDDTELDDIVNLCPSAKCYGSQIQCRSRIQNLVPLWKG